MITAENASGFIAFVFLAAAPVAVLISLVIRRLYRRAIARAMRLRTLANEDAFPRPTSTQPNHADLSFDIAPFDDVTPVRRGLGLRYGLSGLGAALATAAILFLLNGFAFTPFRFAVVTGVFATSALVLALYAAGVRRRYLVIGTTVWGAALAFAVPDTITLILTLVGPALLLAFVVILLALRSTAVPLFVLAVSLVVPLVFSLEIIQALMLLGLLDPLFESLPGTTVGTLYYLLGIGLALLIAFLLGRIVLRFVAWMTARSSEFMMQADLVWTFQAIWLIGLGWGTNGPATLLYLASVPVYRVLLWLLRPRGEAEEINLLLRVFGQQKSQKALARNLLLDWRRTGPVLLIGGEDLATETLDAPELAAFVRGRLGAIFIATPGDLARVSEASASRHSDGLFPMQDYYCRDNAWRGTVLSLMARARRVLVDMRGFHADNAGIQFEINALADLVPTEQITVLVDAGREDEIKMLFAQAWSKAGRPNGTDHLRLRHA